MILERWPHQRAKKTGPRTRQFGCINQEQEQEQEEKEEEEEEEEEEEKEEEKEDGGGGGEFSRLGD